MSLVDLGLIYDVAFQEGYAHVRMTLTSPGCPAGEYLYEEVKKRTLEHSQVQEAEVEIVWDPPWDPRTMASEEVKEVLGIW